MHLRGADLRLARWTAREHPPAKSVYFDRFDVAGQPRERLLQVRDNPRALLPPETEQERKKSALEDLRRGVARILRERQAGLIERTPGRQYLAAESRTGVQEPC